MTVGSRAPTGRRDGRVRSVYLHAPFCARRCFYCDFAVQVRRTGDVDAWFTALSGEMRALRREGLAPLADRLETVYVGGGTPSLLGPAAMERVAALLGPDRLEEPTLEWTAEANPESFTDPVARAWREAGANRLSLGVQSFQEAALRWMGRLHAAEGAVRAVHRARAFGFAEVSVDLIFGLPSHLGRDWDADLDRVLELDVPHVSLYGLTVEAGTPLARAVDAGREDVADEPAYRAEYLRAAERLTAAGYRHYEVSNFARPGSESRHNAAYWDGVPYLGLGNGAHSFLPPVRRWNLRDWSAYESTAVEGRLPEEDREELSPAQARLERLWLALRTRRGVALEVLPVPARDLVGRWVDRGLAEPAPDRVVLTPEGWLVMDRLTVELESRLTSEVEPPYLSAP